MNITTPQHATDCIIQRPAPDCPVCNPNVAMPYSPMGETPTALDTARAAATRAIAHATGPYPTEQIYGIHWPDTIPVGMIGIPTVADTAAYAAMLADPGTPNWTGVVLAAGRLYTELTGRTLPAPGVDDTPEDAARIRLGQVGAAVGLELLHYVIDTDDEQPLEAAAAELREHGDIPESVVVAMAPVVASVLNAAIDAIETARKHQEPQQ